MPAAFQKDEIVGNPDDYRPVLPLDSIMRMIRLTSVIQASGHLSAPWACQLPHYKDELLIYLILSGECIAYTSDRNESIKLAEGDALLIPRPVHHVLADSLQTPPIKLQDMLPTKLKGADSAETFLSQIFDSDMEYGGGGKQTWIITLRLYLDKRFPVSVFSSMPALLPISNLVANNQSFIQQSIGLISASGKEGFIGNTIATRIAESVLSMCIKMVWCESKKSQRSLITRKIDPLVSKILHLVVDNPGANWSVTRMAAQAGMSRSSFFKRFTEVMNQTPNDYVTSLRMIRASELLRNSDRTISEIASETGYSCVASFSRAFRKYTGATPGSIRKV